MRKLFVAAAFAAAQTAAFAALAADFNMKIGFATMNDVQHQWANWYKEALEARSNNRIEVKIFPRGQLGPIASQIEGLQLGTVEAFTTPADFFAGMDRASAPSASRSSSRTPRTPRRCCSIRR